MHECKFCKKEFSKKGIGSHLKSIHKITMKEYYDKFIKNKEEGICPECNCITRFINGVKGYSTFCSTKCAQGSKVTKEKHRQSQIGRKRPSTTGNKNPAKRPEVREKIRLSKIKDWKNGVYDSREYRKKLSIGISKALSGVSYEERHGKEGAERLKEKRRQHMLNGHAQDMCSKIVSPSKPQIELYEMVKSIFPTAQLEYRFLNYSLDIAIPEEKIDIEYDCSYWHTKEKDEKRDHKVTKEGWKVIRFIDILPTVDEIKKHCQQTL